MSHYNELTDFRYGKMLYNINDYPIGRSIKEYGEWCQGEIDLLEKIVRPGMTVIDAGANVGTHSLAFASMVGKDGRVLAFEPQRLIFHQLAGNVALNSIENIWCHYSAISDEHGFIKVGQLDFEKLYNFGALQIETNTSMDKFENVPITIIDDLELDSCHLIKADVEGMEEKALRGAYNTIIKFKPFLYIEDERPEKTESLISYIKSLGYELYKHLTPSFNPNNYKGNTQDLLGGYVSTNILCIPKGKNVDMSKLGTLYKV